MAAALRDPPPGGVSVLGRYRDVVSVLLKHGLADVVDMLHLDRYVPFGRHFVARRARANAVLTREARFRCALEELGPTFVKFGQALSVRADLLSPAVTTELTMLQDHVVPLAAGVAEATVAAELGRPVSALFRVFDPVPVAAGSMAQVHRAELTSGEVVAVKVRRPDIGRVIAGDIEMLKQLAVLLDRHVPAASVVDPIGLVDEFARTIRAEQDLAREGRNIERCARNFAQDATVRLPRVYWDRTTRGVLTLEFLDGIKVSDLAAADVSPFRRRLVAKRGADAMLQQVLVHGFFHADPHPGNVFVLADHVIGFLDFGIVGRLDMRMREFLADVVLAVDARDPVRLGALAREIALNPAGVDIDRLNQDMTTLLDEYADVSLGDLSLSAVLGDIVAVAAWHHLRFPSNLMLLIKAVVTMEGVGRQLDPSFKIVEHAAPAIKRIWRARFTPAALALRATAASRELWSAASAVPEQIASLLRKAGDGRLQVQFVHRNLEHFVREMDRSSNRLSFAIVIGSLVIASSLVMQVGGGAGRYPMLGLTGFLIAGVLGIGLAVGIVRSGRL
jgi:ubiquinone biosynthesis protein